MTLNKIRNWALAAIAIILGIADIAIGILPEIAKEFEIPNSYVRYIRLTIVICGYVLLKLQKPTTNPDKLESMANEERQHRRKQRANKKAKSDIV